MTYDRNIYNGTDVVSETKSNVNVRLLTEIEYNNSGQESGYLNISDNYWLADIYDLNYNRSVNGGGSVYNTGPSGTCSIRPVIKVTSNLTISEGKGTISSPYTVSEKRSSNTSSIKVGEYVSIPKSDGSTYLTRVVKNDSNGVKVILNGLYNTSAFGTNTTLSNTSTVYTGSLTSFKNTLDSKYYNGNNHQYNITTYLNGANWNNNTTMAILDIGLPSIGEMFSGNDIDLSTSINKTFVDTTKIFNSSMNNYYWLGNNYDTSNIRGVNYNGLLYYGDPSNVLGVRPVFYINSGMNITGGNGTTNNPYSLK